MTSNNPSRMRSGIAAVLLCLLIGVPSSLGMAFFLSPQVPSENALIAVAKLKDIPESGVPRLIKVQVPRKNSWQLAVGGTKAIYALRSDDSITAFHSCFRDDLRLPVVYDAERDVFKTIGWNVEFTRYGNGLNRNAGQAMSMDRVETRIADGDILVRF